MRTIKRLFVSFLLLPLLLSILQVSILQGNTPINNTDQQAANPQHNPNMLYNCVDCSYNQYDGFSDKVFNSSYDPIISYEQPKRVKILIQDNNCPNCGLFEVSVREQPRRIANAK